MREQAQVKLNADSRLLYCLYEFEAEAIALSFQSSSALPPLYPTPNRTMSYFLPHLPSGWHVDEAIKSEEDRVVVLRFGHDWDTQCMTMDETLYSVAEKVQNFAVIYLVDITEVPDFNKVTAVFLLSFSFIVETDERLDTRGGGG